MALPIVAWPADASRVRGNGPRVRQSIYEPKTIDRGASLPGRTSSCSNPLRGYVLMIIICYAYVRTFHVFFTPRVLQSVGRSCTAAVMSRDTTLDLSDVKEFRK